MTSVQFKVLGPLEVTVEGEPLGLGGARQRSVLAILLLDPGRVVPAERVIDLIWGDAQGPKTAGTLQVYVSNLRRLLNPISIDRGRPVILTRSPGYLVDLETDDIDLTQLRSLVDSADAAVAQGDLASAVEPLRQAAGLFRGAALCDLDTSLAPITAPIDALRPTLLGRLADAELGLGRHREVLDDLREWSTEHPFDESLRGKLMLAQYRSGRQTDALRTFSEGRELLLDQLGIEPSPELRALESDVLQQDPRLDHPGTTKSPTNSPVLDFDGATELRSIAAAPDAHVRMGNRVIPLDRPVITIGRHPDRHVVVLDPRASRLHAEIRRSDDGFTLVDAGSANGTMVNEMKVAEVRLHDGDVVRIGDTEVEFGLGAPAPGPP